MKNKTLKLFLATLIFVQFSTAAYAIFPALLAGFRLGGTVWKAVSGQVLPATIGIGTAVGIYNFFGQDSTGQTVTGAANLTNTPIIPTAAETAAGWRPGWPVVLPPLTIAPTTTHQVNPAQTISGSGLVYSTLRYSSRNTACATIKITGNGFYGTCTNYVALTETALCTHNPPTSGGGCFNPPQFAANSLTACPSGYVVSGASCALSNASVVPLIADGHCPITRNGNVYSNTPSDPDCAAGSSPQFAADGTWFLSSADGRSIKLTPDQAAGTLKIAESVPDFANNTTTVTTRSLTVPADNSQPPVVAGTSVQVLAGTGTDLTAVPASSGATSADAAALVAAEQATTAAVNALKAEQAAQAAAADVAFAASPPIADSPNSVPALGLPTVNPFQFTVPTWLNTLLPSATADCVHLNVSLPVMGNLEIAPCAVVSVMRPLLDFFLVTMAILTGVFIWFRSGSGS